jgi:hypothetical protein
MHTETDPRHLTFPPKFSPLSLSLKNLLSPFPADLPLSRRSDLPPFQQISPHFLRRPRSLPISTADEAPSISRRTPPFFKRRPRSLPISTADRAPPIFGADPRSLPVSTADQVEAPQSKTNNLWEGSWKIYRSHFFLLVCLISLFLWAPFFYFLF